MRGLVCYSLIELADTQFKLTQPHACTPLAQLNRYGSITDPSKQEQYEVQTRAVVKAVEEHATLEPKPYTLEEIATANMMREKGFGERWVTPHPAPLLPTAATAATATTFTATTPSSRQRPLPRPPRRSLTLQSTNSSPGPPPSEVTQDELGARMSIAARAGGEGAYVSEEECSGVGIVGACVLHVFRVNPNVPLLNRGGTSAAGSMSPGMAFVRAVGEKGDVVRVDTVCTSHPWNAHSMGQLGDDEVADATAMLKLVKEAGFRVVMIFGEFNRLLVHAVFELDNAECVVEVRLGKERYLTRGGTWVIIHAHPQCCLRTCTGPTAALRYAQSHDMTARLVRLMLWPSLGPPTMSVAAVTEKGPGPSWSGPTQIEECASLRFLEIELGKPVDFPDIPSWLQLYFKG